MSSTTLFPNVAAIMTGAVAFIGLALPGVAAPAHARNVIIFVADGLRPGSVNPSDAPTLTSVREKGVFFANSHSVYPTFTMPNASALATGHTPGDTGVFGNVISTGFPVFDKGSFTGVAPRSPTPFIEDDQILGDVDDHFPGANFLGEESLLALARRQGLNTAAVGKLGPTLLQDVTEGNPTAGAATVPRTIVMDDRTGDPAGVPLSPAMIEALTAAGLAAKAPNRSNGAAAKSPGDNGFNGSSTAPGTKAANVAQQRYFVDALTKVILPRFGTDGKPFLVVFWSRDPDGTQHNQGDSLNALTPGINGPTVKLAVQNVDANLKQILDFVKADPKLAASTDVVVTSDHGFSTISRHEVDAAGTVTASGAAKFVYKSADGGPDVTPGFLPPGFLAIDIAAHLKLPLFDPDTQIAGEGGVKVYAPVDWTGERPTATKLVRPKAGNGLIGGTGAGAGKGPRDAKVIVAANGGSDLVYVAQQDRATIRDLAAFLIAQDYVGALFVNDAAGKIPGTLPLSAIRLLGSAQTPAPSLVVAFKTFATDAGDPVNSAVEVTDYTLQQGQGMHGSFGRADIFNNMAAMGPDFKAGFVDRAPASNADIPLTVARILKLPVKSRGKLAGRVLTEALAGKPDKVASQCGVVASPPSDEGFKTWLHYQEVGQGGKTVRYLDAAAKSSDQIAWGDWVGTLPCPSKKVAATKP
jgi:hypothetical protein